ncbi:hypothetical protein [Actinokineospora cianjurensis]|uniref:hypothetical protein n=1 Tax=Actinokineospora cianjurensis TaxID=585224 RepID=UPI0011C4991F|nr:hypothetical protein [Actinokineospora cianjurensis]
MPCLPLNWLSLALSRLSLLTWRPLETGEARLALSWLPLTWLALSRLSRLTWRPLVTGEALLTGLPLLRPRAGRALALRRTGTARRPRRATLRTALPLATSGERRRRVAGGAARGLGLVAVARAGGRERGLDRPVQQPPAVARVHGHVRVSGFTRTWNRRSGRVADVGLVT